jgi:hypothetical protein
MKYPQVKTGIVATNLMSLMVNNLKRSIQEIRIKITKKRKLQTQESLLLKSYQISTSKINLISILLIAGH